MALNPARHNFRIWKGATFRVVLELLVDNAPWKELPEYTGLMEIRKEPNVGEPILTLSTGNGGIVMKEGAIELYIADTVTNTLTWNSGVYDLLITAPKGDTTSILFGGITVRGV